MMHIEKYKSIKMNEQLILFVMDGCKACDRQKLILNKYFKNVIKCTDSCPVKRVPTWYNIRNKKIHVGYLDDSKINSMY
jgi:hypothetical protein